MMKFLKVVVLLVVVLTACDNTKVSESIDYDRTAFLENLADNLIIPAFSTYSDKANTLHQSTLSFETDKSEEKLLILQSNLKQTWLAYQYVAYLEIGPSADEFFREEINIFPTDTAAIQTKIANNDMVFTGAANIDVKGFPAIDYLINGIGESNTDIVNFYNDVEAGQSRIDYLKAVVFAIKQMAEAIDAAWLAYRSTFLEAQGTDIGSSTGILVNEFNKQFDLRLKNGKIGIPSGVKSFERTNPDKVECLYGGYSKELAIASAQAALNIFKGNHFDGAIDGEGFDDYLDALDANTDAGLLSIIIIDGIQNSIERIEAIEGELQSAAQEYNAEGDLVAAYNALQAVIPNIKVDMTSEMGVTISFQDNDGD